MYDGDKYKAICAIVDNFYKTCPAAEAANVALGVVIAIQAVINQEVEE